MTRQDDPDAKTPRFSHDHRKRSLWTWVAPLLLVIVLIVLLPRLAALLGD